MAFTPWISEVFLFFFAFFSSLFKQFLLLCPSNLFCLDFSFVFDIGLKFVEIFLPLVIPYETQWIKCLHLAFTVK